MYALVKRFLSCSSAAARSLFLRHMSQKPMSVSWPVSAFSLARRAKLVCLCVCACVCNVDKVLDDVWQTEAGGARRRPPWPRSPVGPRADPHAPPPAPAHPPQLPAPSPPRGAAPAQL